MATPIPLVPDLQPSLHEVKDVQPLPKTSSGPKVSTTDSDSEAQSLVTPEPITKQLTSTESLEDLVSIDRLQVTRRLKVKGVLFLKGKKNRFFVRSSDQNLVFTIEEENSYRDNSYLLWTYLTPLVLSSWWVGYLCYGLRPMQLHVLNSLGTEVMRISRPYAFTFRVLPCQLQRLQVFSPPERLIGSVLQQWTPVKPLYVVRDAAGHDVFEVHGPRITVSCFQDVQFRIIRPDGSLVASTNKRWQGVMHALFLAPITDQFGMVFFEKAMTGEEKALLLATALLLDYMYYDV